MPIRLFPRTVRALEKYVAQPAKGSLLILDVKAWKKTERLFKLVEQHGLNIECGELKGAELLRWMQQIAKQEYGKALIVRTRR